MSEWTTHKLNWNMDGINNTTDQNGTAKWIQMAVDGRAGIIEVGLKRVSSLQ